MNQLFTSGGQSIAASASASVLPMNIQGWFPLGLTGLIFLQSRELSRVFSSTAVQKNQFFGAQPSLYHTSSYHNNPKCLLFRLEWQHIPNFSILIIQICVHYLNLKKQQLCQLSIYCFSDPNLSFNAQPCGAEGGPPKYLSMGLPL